MEQIRFSQKSIERKKKTYFDVVKELSERLNDRPKKWLGLLKGWKQEDIESVIRSAEKLAKEKNMPFGKAWWIHYNAIVGRQPKLFNKS